MASKDVFWFQFYPADWMTDMAVQSLTFEERGIWFAMLCVMHSCHERGKLIMNGKPISDRALAQLISCDLRKLKRTLTVLETQKVMYKDERGVFYNKRMVEDDLKLQKDRANGKKGGNPNLVKRQVNPDDNPTPTNIELELKLNPKSKKERVLRMAKQCHLNDEWLEQACKEFGIPTHLIRSFCSQWIKDAHLKHKFDKFDNSQLTGFMLEDLLKEKPKLVPPPQQPKNRHDTWN